MKFQNLLTGEIEGEGKKIRWNENK
jgi:hypothetical protein